MMEEIELSISSVSHKYYLLKKREGRLIEPWHKMINLNKRDFKTERVKYHNGTMVSIKEFNNE